MQKRPVKRRRAIVWLDDVDAPVAWNLQWYLNGELHTELGGGVAAGLNAAELIGMLDQLPVRVDPSVIDECYWAGPYDPSKPSHRVKFDLPGWKETQAGQTWYLPTQMTLFG